MHTDWPARQYQDALPRIEWLVAIAFGSGGALMVTPTAAAGWRTAGRPVGAGACPVSAIEPPVVVLSVAEEVDADASFASAVRPAGQTGANDATTGSGRDAGAADVAGVVVRAAATSHTRPRAATAARRGVRECWAGIEKIELTVGKP